MVEIWPGLFVCKQVTVCPGHSWTTLYINSFSSGTTGQLGPRPPHLWGFWMTHARTHARTHGRWDSTEQVINSLLPTQHTTNTRDEHLCFSPGFFFFWIVFLVLSSYFIRSCFFVLIVLFFFTFLPAVQHTQHRHPFTSGEIRTRDPSKRTAADSRLRSPCHSDRRWTNHVVDDLGFLEWHWEGKSTCELEVRFSVALLKLNLT